MAPKRNHSVAFAQSTKKCTMRFLIVAAVLACASASPSGLLAAPYAHGLVGHAGLVAHGAPLAYAHAAPVAYAHAAPLAVAAPTISSGDIQGAAIDAHVEASDHVRASHDAAREYHDQAAELHGQAINAAEDHSWLAVDAVKTREAQLDGAAAGAAPILAKQIAGHAGVYAHAAPVAYASHAAPLAYAAHAAPLAYASHGASLGYAGHGASLGYAGHGASLGYAGHGASLGYASHGAPLAYAAAPAHGHSSSVVSQSLHQSHPAPVYHAAVHSAPALAYGAHAYGAHGLHGW